MTGDDHLARAHAGVARQQRGVGLVLDLLETREIGRGTGVLVGEEPPELGKELGVGLVPADDAQRDGSTVVCPGHQRRTVWLLARQAHVAGIDAHLGQGGGDLGGGRASAWRAEAEVYGGGDAQAEDDATEHVVREPGAEVHGGGGDGKHEQLADAAGRPRQVRRGCGNDGDEDRHAGERELG